MLIYFHIDELNRDAVVASALKKICQDNDWVLIYGNRRLQKLLSKIEFLFDFIILPKPHFISVYFTEKQIRSMQKKIIILYTENIGIIADPRYPKVLLSGALNSEYMSGIEHYVEKVAAFCFWGSQVKDTVVKFYPQLKSVCHVIGHPRHAAISLRRNANIMNEQDFSVGLITRFHILNDYDNRSPAEFIKKITDAGQIFEYKNEYKNESLLFERKGSDGPGDLFNEAIDFQMTLRIIKFLTKRGIKVSLKIHPRENPKLYKSYMNESSGLVHIEDEFTPFTHWAINQKFVVGPASTSFYDCLLLNVVPISTGCLEPDRMLRTKPVYEEFNNLMKFVYSPKNLDDLVEFILLNSTFTNSNSIINSEIRSVLKAETNYPNQGDSLMKLSKILETSAADNNCTTKFKSVKWLVISLVNFYCEVSSVYNYLKNIFRRSKINSNSMNFILNIKNRKKINNLAGSSDQFWMESVK